MILPLGTLFNAGAIIIGGSLGLLLGERLPQHIRTIVFQGLGLSTMALGMQMAIQTSNPLIIIFSILLGGIVGELARLEDRLIQCGEYTKKRFRSNNPKFIDGLVAATLLFCIGSMAVLGPFDEALRGDRSILFTKSLLDFFAAIALASSFGIGVLFSCLPLLLYQGLLTIFATSLSTVLTEAIMQELIATGGLMIIGIGINLLEIQRIRLMNMLPALLFAVLLAKFLV